MSRLQLALNVPDLDSAIEFYSTLFNARPAKVRPGYANFAIDQPPLKLVLIENPNDSAIVNHLGVEHFSIEDVANETNRLGGAGLATDIEESTTCCYAVQKKAWVTGPTNARWEIYTVLSDADTMSPSADCCASDTVSVFLGTADVLQ
jgi:catechol 2,3-dioxygenase-like lactoylglutathione lyase family enzyme